MLVLGTAMIPNTAFAASAPPTAQCVVHDVHLHGTQPATITCGQWNAGSGATLDTWSDHCTSDSARLKIISRESGLWCFYDSGYLGLNPNIYAVNEVDSLKYYDGFQDVCGSGWVLWYYPPYAPGTGHQFYVGSCTVFNSSNSVFGTGDIKITQVDLNP